MADLSDATNWFETDASNNKAPPNGWPEGMLPSGVNDTARSDKGALKRFWDRVNPVQAITPASGVYTFTTSNITYPSAYVEGEIYSFKALAASIGGDQFKVNALAAKPILKVGFGAPNPIAPQDIVPLFPPSLIYNASLNGGAGAFVLLNPFVPASNNGAGGIIVSGDITAANLRATGNLYLGLNYVFFAGNTSSAIGPYAFADTTNFVQRLGSGNGGFYFENSAGTNVAEITNNGSLIAQGNISLGGNAINFAGSGSGGPWVYGDATNMFMQLGPSNGSFIWYSHAGATLMTLAGGGNLTINGSIIASGASNIIEFVDRTGSPTWGWYATGNVARLWNSAPGDRLSVDGAGNLVAVGNVTANGWVYAAGHASKAGAGGGFTGNSFNIEWRPPNVHLWIDLTDEGSIVLADGGGNISANGLTTTGSISGGVAIHATAGAIQSDVGGTAFYAPNGNVVCVGLTVAGGSTFTSGVVMNSGLTVNPSVSGTAIAANGDLSVSTNLTVFGNGYKPGGGSWAATSDVRLKEDVADYSAGLAAVTALRPITYCYNGRGGTLRDGRRFVGLVADEVEGVMPDMVGTLSERLDPDDDAPSEIKTLDASALTYALVNCVKELAARIATLEAK